MVSDARREVIGTPSGLRAQAPAKANTRTGALGAKRPLLRRMGKAAGTLALGAAGLVLGGFPMWAARRMLSPVSTEPLHASLELELPVDRSVPLERVEFASADGQRLSGWLVPAPQSTPRPAPAVILVHGYGGYKEQMIDYAQLVHSGGFAALMFDMRGSGLRRSEAVTLGHMERYDLHGAFRFLQACPDIDPSRIGVLGVSMGAATALLTAAEEPGIKAIVSDSSFADLDCMVRPGLQAFLGSAAVPFAPLILWHAEKMVGARVADVVPRQAAAKLGDRPLFIIHGVNDSLVAADSANRIYEAASGPKELWMVPDCAHGEAPTVAREEYSERVVGFFKRWL